MEQESADLSEGEVLEGDTSTNGGRRARESDSKVADGSTEADLAEPKAKKPRRESAGSEDDPDGKWEFLTKRQAKRRMKRRQKEKKMHSDIEDKLMTSHAPDPAHLNAQQVDIIRCLVRIAKGKQPDQATFKKLKTVQFQSVVSHLVTGSPPLGQVVAGAEDICADYKVVVVWLSMISSNFFQKDAKHFSKVKKFTPCVRFDIEHPGSKTFVKLGLESFMMLANSEGSSAPSSTTAGQGVDDKNKPPRWSYLFTLNELSDNDFPNPLREGGVDQLGRDISSYVGVTEWPQCEVSETSQVLAAKRSSDRGGAAGVSPSEGGGEGVDGGGDGAAMPMFAIDCEMVETSVGSELVRISVVNEALECIYDTFVKPGSPVVDYRTKYSGVSETTLEGVVTTLKDVHGMLTTLLPSNSILVGHSLENDFHAMRFRHPFVIDTSCIFTPLATPTAKPGLRKLCRELLVVDIQNTDQGHNSIEDATACMKLVQLKLERGESCKIAFNVISPSIFTNYRTRGCTTGIVDKESVVRLFGKGSSHAADVKTDEEAVSQSTKIISESKFTFIQLHSMEYLLKAEGDSDRGKVEETARQMDDHVCRVVEGCPPKTLVFVVCGSSDIRKVRNIQQQEFPNPQDLRMHVMRARTGCVVGVVVN